ncbi:hypothetical protein HDU96_000785 [Phlyctochytrium bullatum]|nr:hypothetical protein HDU96_000785 [Phlyctochytrium bullatum]
MHPTRRRDQERGTHFRDFRRKTTKRRLQKPAGDGVNGTLGSKDKVTPKRVIVKNSPSSFDELTLPEKRRRIALHENYQPALADRTNTSTIKPVPGLDVYVANLKAAGPRSHFRLVKPSAVLEKEILAAVLRKNFWSSSDHTRINKGTFNFFKSRESQIESFKNTPDALFAHVQVKKRKAIRYFCRKTDHDPDFSELKRNIARKIQHLGIKQIKHVFLNLSAEQVERFTPDLAEWREIYDRVDDIQTGLPLCYKDIDSTSEPGQGQTAAQRYSLRTRSNAIPNNENSVDDSSDDEDYVTASSEDDVSIDEEEVSEESDLEDNKPQQMRLSAKARHVRVLSVLEESQQFTPASYYRIKGKINKINPESDCVFHPRKGHSNSSCRIQQAFANDRELDVIRPDDVCVFHSTHANSECQLQKQMLFIDIDYHAHDLIRRAVAKMRDVAKHITYLALQVAKSLKGTPESSRKSMRPVNKSDKFLDEGYTESATDRGEFWVVHCCAWHKSLEWYMLPNESKDIFAADFQTLLTVLDPFLRGISEEALRIFPDWGKMQRILDRELVEATTEEFNFQVSLRKAGKTLPNFRVIHGWIQRGQHPLKRPFGLSVPGSVFGGMAINHDIASTLHKDSDDLPHGICAVIPVGNFRGGQLRLIEAAAEIKLRAAEPAFFRSNMLTHGNEMANGIRGSIILFTDAGMYRWLVPRLECRGSARSDDCDFVKAFLAEGHFDWKPKRRKGDGRDLYLLARYLKWRFAEAEKELPTFNSLPTEDRPEWTTPFKEYLTDTVVIDGQTEKERLYRWILLYLSYQSDIASEDLKLFRDLENDAEVDRGVWAEARVEYEKKKREREEKRYEKERGKKRKLQLQRSALTVG